MRETKEEKLEARKATGCTSVVEVLDLRGLCEDMWPMIQEMYEKSGRTNEIKNFDSVKNLYRWGIVNTEQGWYILCDEGVMYPVGDEFLLPVYGEGKALSIFPVSEVLLELEDILDLPVFEHVPLDEFIRIHNDRLESNFSICARELTSAGPLPPREFSQT